ncbi:MAG: hypothetical protein N3D72_01600 [Candidatus Methanomethyliaceae archaeon]|nr:hypothetical protein [Candidatus Methanomethyliaceae archaeon]
MLSETYDVHHYVAIFRKEKLYSYDYDCIHIFSPDKMSLEEVISIGEREVFGEWRVVGRETLQLSKPLKKRYVILLSFLYENFGRRMEVRGNTLPDDIIKELIHLKKSRLTLDINLLGVYDTEFSLPELLMKIEEFLKRFCFQWKFYKSTRGFHLRALLIQPMEILEILKIRKMFYDNPERVWFDEFKVKEGVAFLSDVLFNEKMFKDDGRVCYYAENEADIYNEKFPYRTFITLGKSLINDIVFDSIKEKIKHELREKLEKRDIRLIDMYENEFIIEVKLKDVKKIEKIIAYELADIMHEEMKKGVEVNPSRILFYHPDNNIRFNSNLFKVKVLERDGTTLAIIKVPNSLMEKFVGKDGKYITSLSSLLNVKIIPEDLFKD